MKFIVRLFALTLLPFGCFAQFTITGRVLNQADTKPVADASVFLNNTVTGDRTTKDGTFRLENVKPGKYKLIISIIGFEPYNATINVVNANIKLPDITIFPKTTTLNEVTIRVNHNREKYFNIYYDRFKNAFLGTSDIAKDCRIENPEILDFDYSDETNTLTVSSADFLKIDNDDLGYKINYLLTSFTLNDATNDLHYEGPVLFTEMKGSPSQERRWQQNRRLVYEGSEMHFLRALLNDALESEGFHAFQLAIYPNPARLPDDILTAKLAKFGDPAYRKSIESRAQSGCKDCLIDSLPFYKKMAKLPKATQTLFPYNLSKDDLVLSTRQPGIFALECDGAAIVIEYDKSHHFTPTNRLTDLSNLGFILNKSSNRGLTMIDFKAPALLFDSNGWPTDPNSVNISGAWGLNRVAGLLPVSYETPQIKNEVIRADTVFNNLKAKMESFAANHPVEKVHLHLDRPWYGLGDTIWFKAYTVAGERHIPTTISNVLYTELINDKDSIVNSHIIALNDGAGKGDFVIPFSYRSGTYRLRAYTSYMRNDSDYFYNQPLIIGGLEAPAAGAKTLITSAAGNHTTQKANPKPDVQFFPEGGELITGLRSRVAFKAVYPDGSAANIAGVIADQDGTEVASFSTQHAGMGQFPLTPLTGKIYTAKIFCADGTGFLVDLPKAKDSGFTLTINNSVDSVYVKVAANDAIYRSRRDTIFYLIAQSGGKYYLAAGGRVSNKVFTTQIARDRFPSGVIQFTLFSQSGEPLNERVIFVQNDDPFKVFITTDKTGYKANENVKIALKTEGTGEKPAPGSFSVSVTDETKVPVDEQAETTIFTDLLLTSELKGYIAGPNYYFINQTSKTRSDLDLLMLTQGYRRFEWKKVLAGNDKIVFKPENTLSLSGTIKTPGNKPLPNARVKLTSIKDYFSADTLTDANGNFTFTNINLPDTAKVIINAKNQKGGDNVKITITEPIYPAIKKSTVAHSFADSSFSLNVRDALQRSYLAGKKLSLKNVIQLKEVHINDRKKNPVFEPTYSDNMKYSQNLNGPGKADQVILGENLLGCTVLSDCLRAKIIGVTITPDGVIYNTRAINRRFRGGPKPMAIIIGGLQVSPQDLNRINAQDIYSIEVLRSGASVAIYGSNASAGAIIITLKRGSDFKATNGPVDGLITYQFKGYYKAREFYSPKYAAGQPVNPADDRKTIYWNPDIITDANGKASFGFFNAGSPGLYRVVVEGIDGNGNIGRQVYGYQVE